MNRGTVGFLLNRFKADGLVERVSAATRIDVHPLTMRAVSTSGQVVEARAFNEVAVTRKSAQSVNIRVSIDGVERLGNFVGDGLIIATAAGSTAYNLSAHGPILPLGSGLLALTPISPFRPRRWRGALLRQSDDRAGQPGIPTSGRSPPRPIPGAGRHRVSVGPAGPWVAGRCGSRSPRRTG
jgi:NAD+ kinase